MNSRAFVLAALASLAAVQAQVTSINYNQLEPFPRPSPKATAERAVVKYKPQLDVSFGCHPYPAVHADGFVSAGLKGSGLSDGDCKGPSFVLQMYMHLDWFKDRRPSRSRDICLNDGSAGVVTFGRLLSAGSTIPP
ncbi:hypothetical protein ON010_g2008 [Phytophthora cinnamomi]|nr:hypothetical protein ON010_g2008 [Phytophthora cinnamomi]